MRRLLAILLLCSFSAWPAAPVFASPQSKLPSCCRRDGKHHCTQPRPNENGSRLGAKCPCMPGMATFGQHSQPYTNLGSSHSVAARFARVAAPSQTEPLRRTLFSRFRQKRAPPSLLS